MVMPLPTNQYGVAYMEDAIDIDEDDDLSDTPCQESVLMCLYSVLVQCH